MQCVHMIPKYITMTISFWVGTVTILHSVVPVSSYLGLKARRFIVVDVNQKTEAGHWHEYLQMIFGRKMYVPIGHMTVKCSHMDDGLFW